MLFTFADIEVDTQRYELRRGGKSVAVEPLIFDLIVFLINHTDELFNRDELIDAVWQGRVVSDSTVSSAIKSARKALGDDGTKQQYIKTVHGRGFKLSATINKTDDGSASSSDRTTKRRTQDDLPSVVVIGFKNLPESASVLQLSSALQANIETILTRVPLLNISAQSTDSNDNLSGTTARQLYEQLGIDYVIDGMIQVIENSYRVNINLTQAKSGFRIWSEQFEHNTENYQSALDTLVIKVLSKLEPQLNRAIHNDVKSNSDQPDAKLLYLQASTLLATKGWHQSSFLEAAELLEQSMKIEPHFALAPAYLSLVLALGHRVGLLSRNSTIKDRAIAAADCALDLDNMDSTVLGFSGCALADVGVLTRAFAILKNAIEINPANAQAWTALGSAYLINKQPEKAIEHLSHGIKISPIDTRLSIWEAVLALAYLQSGQLSEAQLSANLACQRDDKTYLPRIVLAAIFIADNQTKQAKDALDDAFRIKPDLSANEITGAAGKFFARRLLQLHR